jgi:hypothetical protein
VSAEHDHDFGLAVAYPAGTARMCRYPDCTEWAVRQRSPKRWREPTDQELLSIVARMWEDLIWIDALTLTHRNDRDYAIRRIAEMRGYR